MKFSWGREEVDGREVGPLDQQSSKNSSRDAITASNGQL